MIHFRPKQPPLGKKNADALQHYLDAMVARNDPAHRDKELQAAIDCAGDYRQRVLDLDDALTALESFVYAQGNLVEKLRLRFSRLAHRVKAAHGQARRVRAGQ